MSYTLIKKLRIVRDTDGSYYAATTQTANNDYAVNPRTGALYHAFTPWDFFKGKGKTLDEVERGILEAYWSGDFQGGANKYRAFVEAVYFGVVPSPFAELYRRTQKAVERAQRITWDHSQSDERRAWYAAILRRLCGMRDYSQLLAEFRAYKPDTTSRYIFKRSGHVVISCGLSNFRYSYRTDAAPKVFDALAAAKFANRFKDCPQLEQIKIV